MIYETQYGTVDFWSPYNLERFTKIGINLSGGCDSALVTFFTCRELQSTKSDAMIVPITGVHNARPSCLWHAEEIVLLFKEMFPDVRWDKHRIDHYDKSHEKDKINHHVAHENRLRSEGIIDVLFHGRTANPPEEEAKKHNLLYKRETKRDVHGNNRKPYHELHGHAFYCPFEYVDKRFVSENYKKFNLMEELFPITASCVGYAKATDNFSKPCKECWWCREKKWAFGMYDGCVQ